MPFNPDDHVQYVNHWIEALQKDPREIMRAAQDVEKILTFMKVPEIQYEKVPVIEQVKEMPVELPDPKASLARIRSHHKSKGHEQTLSL